MLLRGHCRGPDGGDAREIGHEHHVLAAVAVGERRSEGSHRRGRGEADGRQRSDRRHPARLVGEDGDRDPVGVRSRHGAGEGELYLPDVRIREDPPEGPERLTDPGAEREGHTAENLSI